ncbi:MAG TPA: glycosyltransferase [Leptolyngbyaceae cyanobacterium M33_DOE_097]|uniref:Glycosyltransferase n=1 Tax=Oscillatoriales cyanobacterium SpSt-418 TaxID=2282169 RepID=A0A7C3PG86_9CYAN|nr:glycosyltransferase [Leptolyngbyaceae cyanobacterium M33_DOE_097]
MIVFALMLIALYGISRYLTALKQAAAAADDIQPLLAESPHPRATSVIIPAYNEALNVRECVLSVLNSAATDPQLQVWFVDDQSDDATLAIAHALQAELQDTRFHILTGQPRPNGEVWRGKNWACHQGAQQATGDYLLFIDADVRLKPGAIATAAHIVEAESLDLLTLIPQVECGFLGEWLVQPMIMGLLTAGFNFGEVNNPTSEAAFAAGPFMFFRQSAYTTLGGHQAVAAEVVEDVELARRIKSKGLRLKFAPGQALASVRMYRTWSGLWEGWTKNWHAGSRRDLGTSLFSALIPFLVGVLPWLGLGYLAMRLLGQPLSIWEGLAGVVAGVVIALHYQMRKILLGILGLPLRYWWLTGLGSLITAILVLVSIVKTETGWGWTWRGRSLKSENS